MKINDPTARMRALMDLVAGLQKDDFAPAAEKLKALGIASDSQEMQLLVSAWCNVDVPAAAGFALGREVPGLIKIVGEEWGRQNYDQAVEWALAIPRSQIGFSKTRSYALAQVVLPTVDHDPGRALATVLRTLRPGRMRYQDGLLPEQVVAAIMRHCPGRIEALIGSMPDGPDKEMATRLMIDRIADPGGTFSSVVLPGGAVDVQVESVPEISPGEIALAAESIAQSSRTMPEGQPALAGPDLFLKYALADREAATSLMDSMPAGVTRENALAGIAAAIASNDGIVTGLAYLQDSQEETRRLLLDSWACHVAPQDPVAVLESAELLADFPDGKCRLLIGMAYAYLRDSDNAAAERWVADHPQFTAFVRRKPRE